MRGLTLIAMNVALRSRTLSVLAGLLMLTTATDAQSLGSTWRYRLLHDSTLLDECPACGRPSIPFPVRGTFDLVQPSHGTDATYTVTNLLFVSTLFNRDAVTITGDGTLVRDPASGQPSMTLRLNFSHAPASNYVFVMEPEPPAVQRLWPSFQVSLVETQSATITQTFHLTLLAAPVRELWFSTVHGMTAGLPGPENRRISADDLLADNATVLRHGSDLLKGVGLPPDLLPPATDALHIGPGGEAMFSLVKDGMSPDLGGISAGDLISERGRMVRRNGELLGQFGFMPPIPELGLNAVQLGTQGEILFTIRDSAFSERLGVTVGPGDILSDRGEVFRSAKELLAAFKPSNQDLPAVDAFYVWPSGEVWFSTASGYTNAMIPIRPGDLLSDQGYLVFENLELLNAFAPLEDLADFGLDALQVVTEAAPPRPAPTLGPTTWQSNPPTLTLQWAGDGTAFQVEAAENPEGPWQPLSGILGAATWSDLALPSANHRFYRVRQW